MADYEIVDDLGNTLVDTDGNPIVYFRAPPALRTFTVAAESRRAAVRTEPRTAPVPAEDRTLTA